ncbi:hypothetical protein A5714_03445 [Mycobacterium sp. E2462]|uniref:hypothetical protein n=1 Tax=Mycobacterium sp. E2462 TaxID=1834133 RepID=UPI0007FD0BBD|nr:hypothetical protein A5714_03445 [Mycobacterium sp. E2462]
MHPTEAASLRRAKIGVTVTFLAHAMVASSWVAHIPQIKGHLGLSDAALGTALFGAPLDRRGLGVHRHV